MAHGIGSKNVSAQVDGLLAYGKSLPESAPKKTTAEFKAELAQAMRQLRDPEVRESLRAFASERLRNRASLVEDSDPKAAARYREFADKVEHFDFKNPAHLREAARALEWYAGKD